MHMMMIKIVYLILSTGSTAGRAQSKPAMQHFIRIDVFAVSGTVTVALHFDHSKKCSEKRLLCHKLDKTNLFLCTGVRNHIIND